MNPNREYRSMALSIPQDGEYMVEGYASTYDAYTLFERDGVKYKERIEPDAFKDADMSDVVFRVDHTGRVYARSTAGTVELWTDDHGLGHKTNLGRTQAGRELYADIAAGNYPQMSFAFTVAEDEYDRATHTRIVKKVKKVFDISPVSFPANPYTELSVSTRDYFDGVIEAERAERLERERKKKLLKLLLEV